MRTLQNTLRRQTFTVSREAEYFTRDELERQTGYLADAWFPEVIAKELLDNALDECEAAGRAPEISVSLDDEWLEIRDNGDGITPDVVRRILDFTTRTSDKQAYVSPTRGAQGNALKSIVGMAYVLGGAEKCVEIQSRGVRHRIVVEKDLSGKPKVTSEPTPIVRIDGTLVRVPALRSTSLTTANSIGILQKLLFEYIFFNPHGVFRFNGEPVGSRLLGELHKWKSYDPPSGSVWWYDADRFDQLVRAYVTDEKRSKKILTVRAFIATFDRLTLSAKQKRVTDRTDLKGEYLHDLVIDDGKKLDTAALEKLREAMRAESRPVQPRALGILGEGYFRLRMSDAATANTFRYARETGFDDDGLPFVVEAAFAIVESNNAAHYLHVGLNFAAPPGVTGRLRHELPEVIPGLHAELAEQRLGPFESEAAIILHLAHPRFHFADKGKSRVLLDATFRAAVWKALHKVTKKWAAIQKAKDQERAKKMAQLKRQYFTKPKKERNPSFKELAPEFILPAYEKASWSEMLQTHCRVNPRQIYYVLRDPLSEAAGKKDKPISYHYFSQELLPTYILEHPDVTKGWRIDYDERGHLEEPHSGVRIGIGTLSVEEYIEMFTEGLTDQATNTPAPTPTPCPVSGPGRCYGTVLFIEKEGFDGQVCEAEIPQRYDVALASTKGLSNVAARNLFVALGEIGVRVVVLHDFDERGFIICGTLSGDTDRYQFKGEKPKIIELGLRLADAKEMGLVSEYVEYDHDPEKNLVKYGATKEERAFLRRGAIEGSKKKFWGERIELNAMTRDQFIEYVETKLEEAGVEKVIPDEEVINPLYLQARQARLDAPRVALQLRLDERRITRQAKLDAEAAAKREQVRDKIHGKIWRDFMKEHGKEMARLDTKVDELNEKAQRKIKPAKKLKARIVKPKKG